MAPNQSARKQLYLNVGVFSKHTIRYVSESSSAVGLKNGPNTYEMLLTHLPEICACIFGSM